MTDDERLIFTDFKFNHFPDARCRAEVELTRRSGDQVVGMREVKGTEIVALRCAAQATMDAIQKVVDPERSFDIASPNGIFVQNAMLAL